jgi:hypothetical protein
MIHTAVSPTPIPASRVDLLIEPPPLPAIRSLKHYLRPEPGNESAPSNPTHISIVLNHRLDQEGSIKHQNVELNAVLGLRQGSLLPTTQW